MLILDSQQSLLKVIQMLSTRHAGTGMALNYLQLVKIKSCELLILGTATLKRFYLLKYLLKIMH